MWTESISQIEITSYLALEYADNKDLLGYLLNQTETEFVQEKWVRYWFRQILAALIHMRTTNHSHLDIKGENILLDASLNVKIADFGFS